VVGFTYDYPRPALSTDIAVFQILGGRLELLLIERRADPFAGQWALPGGFLEPEEDLDACAARELAEETGLTGLTLHPFATFSTPGRDPRGWTVSAGYLTVSATPLCAQAGDDAADARWFALNDLPALAFDHADIVGKARAWLAGHPGIVGLDPALL
jgi:8-oxo-dGTP diphosphatase